MPVRDQLQGEIPATGFQSREQFEKWWQQHHEMISTMQDWFTQIEAVGPVVK
jgi:hypothetical protein